MTSQDETPDKRTPEQIAKYYQEQLELAKKDHQNFLEDGKRVNKQFKNGRDALRARTKRLNILYSNTEVLRAALYGKSATPDVRRRFGMEDKAAGSVAAILEKSLVYCAEAYDSDKQIELGILDYLLPGRGVVRIEYEPTLSTDPQSGQQFITDQKVQEKYVHWQDFRHMPARTWDDILKHGWVSFAHRMTRAECVENFGAEIGNKVPLNWMPDIADKKDAPNSLKKAEVFEIWDVNDRKRYWIVEGFEQVCRVDDDPYGLEQFFPLPEPPAYYTTTDSIIPEPEFHIYQDQADDLDEIIARISRLTRALKRRGVYDQSVKELSRLANAADNQFIAVENYQALATKGGLAAAFQTEDISIIATVLIQLYQQKDMLIQAIWELVGIADIMRGQTQASETLGAQQLKAQFGSQRLKRRQRTIQKWVANLLKLKAEIISEHFQPEVLTQMTGEQITPEVMQILRTDKLRAYRVEVETDSTVFEDAEAEKATRSALITAVSQFITAWGPIVGQSPPLAPVAFELLKFGLGAFKSTRSIEDAIEQAAGLLEQEAAAKAQQGPPPDPEMVKAQAQIQADQAKAQSDAQIAQQKIAADAQAAQQQAAIDHQKQQDELALKREEMQLKREEAIAAHEREMTKITLQARVDRAKLRQQEKADRAKQSLALRQAKTDVALKNKQISAKEKERGMMDDDIQLEDDPMDEDVGLEPDAMEQTLQQLVQVQQQSQAQFAQVVQQISELQAHVGQMLSQALQQVAQSNQMVAQAMEGLSRPRRRVAVRDSEGRISHADDMPL